MHPEIVDRIVVPRFAGVRPNARGFPRHVAALGLAGVVVRGSVAAVASAPAEGGPASVAMVTARGALARMLAPIREAMRRRRKPTVIAGAHDLGMLLGAALYPHVRPWTVRAAKNGTVEVDGAVLEWWAGATWFARLRAGRSSALLFDVGRFFGQDLSAAVQTVGAPWRDVPRPEGYGERRLGVRAVGPVVARDAEATAGLVGAVLRWHRERDLYPSVSIAQLSMRYFRHRYLRRRWQAVPPQVLEAALLAYHGGRSALYVPPGWVRVTALDMRAAYGWAMAMLPPLADGRWERVTRWAGPWAFYRLTGGTVYQGRYPLLYSHDYRPLPSGMVTEPVWVSGVELEAAREAGVIQGARYWGYVWRPTSLDRPLRRYVLECWRKRNRAKTEEARTLWKLLVVSLYGKFAAKLEADGDDAADLTGDESLRARGPNGVLLAGGQFYPPAAAWITALVRVRLWRREWTETSLHTATDGMLVVAGTSYESSDALGGWRVDGENLWALLLRYNLYGLFDAGGRLVKLAAQGFYGTPADFVEMVRCGKAQYVLHRARGWIEAAAAGRKPYVPEATEFAVRAGVSGFWPPPMGKIILPGPGGDTVIEG